MGPLSRLPSTARVTIQQEPCGTGSEADLNITPHLYPKRWNIKMVLDVGKQED